MSELEFVRWAWGAFLFWHALVLGLTTMAVTLTVGLWLLVLEIRDWRQ